MWSPNVESIAFFGNSQEPPLWYTRLQETVLTRAGVNRTAIKHQTYQQPKCLISTNKCLLFRECKIGRCLDLAYSCLGPPYYPKAFQNKTC